MNAVYIQSLGGSVKAISFFDSKPPNNMFDVISAFPF